MSVDFSNQCGSLCLACLADRAHSMNLTIQSVARSDVNMTLVVRDLKPSEAMIKTMIANLFFIRQWFTGLVQHRAISGQHRCPK